MKEFRLIWSPLYKVGWKSGQQSLALQIPHKPTMKALSCILLCALVAGVLCRYYQPYYNPYYYNAYSDDELLQFANLHGYKYMPYAGAYFGYRFYYPDFYPQRFYFYGAFPGKSNFNIPLQKLNQNSISCCCGFCQRFRQLAFKSDNTVQKRKQFNNTVYQ